MAFLHFTYHNKETGNPEIRKSGNRKWIRKSGNRKNRHTAVDRFFSYPGSFRHPTQQSSRAPFFVVPVRRALLRTYSKNFFQRTPELRNSGTQNSAREWKIRNSGTPELPKFQVVGTYHFSYRYYWVAEPKPWVLSIYICLRYNLLQ